MNYINAIFSALALMLFSQSQAWAADPSGWAQVGDPKAVAAIKATVFPSLGTETLGDVFGDWTVCDDGPTSGWVTTKDENDAPITAFKCGMKNPREHLASILKFSSKMRDGITRVAMDSLRKVSEFFVFSIGRSSGVARLTAVYQYFEWADGSNYTLPISDTTTEMMNAYQGKPWQFLPGYDPSADLKGQFEAAGMEFIYVDAGISDHESFREVLLLRQIYELAAAEAKKQ